MSWRLVTRGVRDGAGIPSSLIVVLEVLPSQSVRRAYVEDHSLTDNVDDDSWVDKTFERVRRTLQPAGGTASRKSQGRAGQQSCTQRVGTPVLPLV